MSLKEIVDSSRRFFDSKTARIATGAVSTAGVTADIISQTSQRGLLPPFIAEHAGNFGIPFVFIFASGLLAKRLEQYGVRSENKALKEWGKLLYFSAAVFVAGVNVGVEAQFIRRPDLLRENALDCAVGFFAMACALEVTRGARKWIEANF